MFFNHVLVVFSIQYGEGKESDFCQTIVYEILTVEMRRIK